MTLSISTLTSFYFVLLLLAIVFSYRFWWWEFRSQNFLGVLHSMPKPKVSQIEGYPSVFLDWWTQNCNA